MTRVRHPVRRSGAVLRRGGVPGRGGGLGRPHHEAVPDLPDPVVDRSGDNLRNTFEGQVAVFMYELDQALLAEFAKLVLRLSDAVTVGKENFAGAELHGSFVVIDVVKKSPSRLYQAYITFIQKMCEKKSCFKSKINQKI